MGRKPVRLTVKNARFPHNRTQALVAQALSEGIGTTKLLALATELSTRTVLRVLTAAGMVVSYQELMTAHGKRRIWYMLHPKMWESIIIPRANDLVSARIAPISQDILTVL